MAKSALLGVLESTIGKYVVDLDAEKLNLGVWSGKVELHDLQLDVDKCNAELDRQAAEAPNLAIPLRVVGGQFASLELSIPWSSLSSQSVVVKARGLHIHVAPHDRLTKSDFLKQVVDSEEKRAQNVKQQRLQSLQLADQNRKHKLELLKLTQFNNDSENSNDSTRSSGTNSTSTGSSNQESGFVARLVRRIVENLQVDIQDVQVTLQGDAGTAGVVLQNLSFVTTDMAGHRTFVDRTKNDNPSDLLNKFLYKNLSIQGVAIYIDEPNNNKEGHQYILDPLTWEAKAREADVSITKEYPKWLLKSHIPSVQLGLSQRQYQQTMALLAAMAPSPHAARPLFPEYRPLRRITAASAKEWWQYAFRCVSRLNGRRSWVIFFEAFQARKTYVALWKRHVHAATCPWMTALSEEELQTMQTIEADRTLSVDGIMAWRNLADAQVNLEKQKRQQASEAANSSSRKKKKSGGMLSNLFGGKSSSSDDEPDDQDSTPITLTTEELKELENIGLDQVGGGGNEQEELSQESKLCRVEFVLGELKIYLAKNDNLPMLGLDMGTVSSTFDADKGGTFTFDYSLQSLEVSDHLHSSSLFPKLLRSLAPPTTTTSNDDATKETETPAFQVHVSHAKSGDKKLTVNLVPFEIVVAPHLLSEVVAFAKVPPEMQPSHIKNDKPLIEEIHDEDNDDEGIADDKKPNSKEDDNADATASSEYAEGISNALVDAWREKTKEKTLLAIDLNLNAPVLVLPENCTDPNASVLVLDLGGFRFQYGSLTDPAEKVTRWLKDNPRDQTSYNLTNTQQDKNQAAAAAAVAVVDHGRLELEHMTFLVGQAEHWRKITSDQEGMTVHSQDEAIIEPISVRFDFAVESVVASSIPRACVFVAIPTSNFKFSPNHLSMTLQVYNAWMKTLESVRGEPPKPARGKPVENNHPEQDTSSQDPSTTPDEKGAASTDPKSTVSTGNGEVVAVEIDDVTKTVETSLGNDTALFTTMYLDLCFEKYSFVVYDSGEFQSQGFNGHDSMSGSISPILNVAEGLVLEGGLSLSVAMASDQSGNTSSITTELKGQDFQLYSAFGRDLRRPLQILEPVNGSVKVGLISQGVDTKKADLKARCHDEIDLTFSMRNMALINAISAEVSQCLEDGLARAGEAAENMPLETLDEEQKHQIEAMAAALESDSKENDKATAVVQAQSTTNDGIRADNASSTIFSINVKMPKAKLTIINDLQGLDEALFRIQVQEFITRSLIANMQDLDNALATQTTFNVKVHAKILADYYDPSVNLWNPLLREPWETAFKGERIPGTTKDTSGRYSSTTDVHFEPLYLSFSEQFLIGLGSTNRMLQMSAELEQEKKEANEQKEAIDSLQKPRSHSTRNLVAALPYALDNFSGIDVEYTLAGSRVGDQRCPCPNGTKQYFKFNPPKGRGRGGKREYGQDILANQSIKILIGKNTIEIHRIDDQLGQAKVCHVIDDGTLLVTTVVKEGKSTVIRLSSNTYMQNRSPIPLHISILHGSKDYEIGICKPTSSLLEGKKQHLVPYDVKGGTLSKQSRRMGVRFEGQEELVKEWAAKGKGSATFKISPHFGNESALGFEGQLHLEADIESMQKAENNTIRSRTDIVCTSKDPDGTEFVLQAAVKLQLIQGTKVVIFISLEPRAQLVNTLPVNVTVLTRSPHCYSHYTLEKPDRDDKIHDLEPGGKLEVYSGGDSLAIKVQCSESPGKGTPLATTRQWIPIPMACPLEKPMLCLLPFVAEQELLSSLGTPGNEFFIAEANSSLPSFFLERINDDGSGFAIPEPAKSLNHTARTLLLTVGNYGVDHTGSVMFEQMVTKSKGFFGSASQKDPLPFGTFMEAGSKRGLSLLPTSEIPLRLAKPGEDRKQRSAVFRVEEVSMSEGGAQATPLLWDNGRQSGYYAYRKLVSSFQSELHIIAEFVVYNGDPRHHVVVRQNGGPDVRIAPCEAIPVYAVDRNLGLFLSFHYDVIGGATKSLRLDELGLHIELVKNFAGDTLGSLAVQTSIGTVDSRLLIKLGEVGEIERRKAGPLAFVPSKFNEDNIRFRIKAEKVSVTLAEAVFVDLDTDGKGVIERASPDVPQQRSERPALAKAAHEDSGTIQSSIYKRTEKPICTVVMQTVVYDVQRLFKPEKEVKDNERPERCQLSLIIHDFQIRDETPQSPFPIVFKFKGENRFVDFCLRTKGPLYASNVNVDLYDLVLAHSGQGDDQSGDKMILQTSETFVWKLIDLADLIVRASAEGARPTDGGELDRALEAYVPAYSQDAPIQHVGPQVSTIYNITRARVSPFSIVVSFKRTPDAQRYEKFVNNQGANLMRYVTQQLKFTIENCDLHFARYEELNLHGPMDRLIEILTAVYVSRMKLKVVKILTAASFGDWKNLAARDGGDDEFVDGDILRVTGSVAGNSVAFALNQAGRGLHKSVTMGFDAIGDGVENGASMLGAHDFGAGAKTVLSGVGGGIGGTLQGVGDGAGSLFKGAGAGLGHLFGGLTGGGSRIVKGVGESITTGDGRALATGLAEGVGHVGKGIRGSVMAVGTGVSGSVTSVVSGTTTGVRESVNSAGSQTSAKKHQRDLARIREEFKDQDYS